MLTALVSLASGLVSGLAPKLIKEYVDTRESKREVELLEKQTELQIKLVENQVAGKIAEMDRKVDIAAYDSQARIATATLNSTGIRFVDGWNGCLRPFACTLIILMFASIAGFYAYSVLDAVDDLAQAQEAVSLLWGSLIGESIQAVLGFLFGYRSARK